MSDVEVETPGINPETVGPWLGDHVDGIKLPVEFSLVSGGRSNLTYQVKDAAGVVRALRRPPTGGVLSTAHDMSREWKFISALAPTDVPVAEPLAYCEDRNITGADFYVMGYVDGTVLNGVEDAETLSLDARRHVAEDTIDVLVRMHSIDPAEVGLGEMGRSAGYLERQLRRWKRQVHDSGADELDILDETHDALLAGMPDQTNGIVHGDYRPGNMSFSSDGSILAIFDWELATLGDPFADLGWLITTWARPTDEHPPTTGGPTMADGFASSEELVERYARLSGRDVSDLPYWVAFSRWRSACITAGVRARYRAGVMGNDGYAEQITKESRLEQAYAAHAAVQELGLLKKG